MTDYKEYIYAIYQEKSFSKAAKKLYVSQPWLSATVKKVEQQLQIPLFDRSTNPISLTDAGRYYIEQIERIMAIEEEMQRHFNEMRSVNNVELHIGSSMFFCTYVLPKLLTDFCALYPQVTLTFTEGTTSGLTEKLRAGQLDFLLEAECPSGSDIQTFPWASEQIILAVPAHYEINQRLEPYRYTFEGLLRRDELEHRRPPVPLHHFKDEPFLLLKPDNDVHDRSLTLCRNAGFTPNVSLYLSQMMTAYYLVCEGKGITFLRTTIPEFVTPTSGVVFYLLDDPQAFRNIYLSYSRNKTSPIHRQLIEFMRGESPGKNWSRR
ncbi:Morphology and auto-aggregation control protein [uncultured Flavonifractor sp.]|jgi:DNA-binding transcriptional LysR family regulator|uniref:LysR family transcriptional regulator n=1 Tax=Flintibacter hominis TaxID=2763048 RepID=A0A8J6MCQ2_9FIRM|nr:MULTISPECIES: LysR family transcriptional regulator [Eubacteriales]SCH84584.1 Morphology and auto-aggregation control protein [uncultured Clostridium sp.]SCI59205.1 Morphology and auto-aggregation control protein [uncultured Flavonifractor sp.]MBC5722076.1 LysR family transcriptional regulator [Flintibacter hominis]MCH1980690.1 LysR family transcriptional regulator [Lawsonibacter sp. OA9]MCU6701386.1 LysR family transcriptional regulator [Muriventricola aceti]